MENVAYSTPASSQTLQTTIKPTGGNRIPWYSSSQKRFYSNFDSFLLKNLCEHTQKNNN
jgi:hypothetical protein